LLLGGSGSSLDWGVDDKDEKKEVELPASSGARPVERVQL
jgi:hypothetical protein